MPTASITIISHIHKFRDQAWDQNVLERTKLCLLDSLACFSTGLEAEHYRQSARGVVASFGCPQSSPFLTAYLYGQAANAIDFDDTLHGHPGAPIIGAVLAISAANSLTIDRVLRGIAAGYEAHEILWLAAVPSADRVSAVRSVGNWATVAGGIGASVALGHDDSMIKRVIDVAAAHSLVPYTAKWYQRPVPAMKNNMGWIAGGAVHAVNLAMTGQTGVTDALDGDKGLWRMLGSDQWQLTESILSRKPAVLRTGFKEYPSCWHTQEHLKALSSLRSGLDSDDRVTDIVVSGPADVEKFCHSELHGTADIAFSFPALFQRLLEGLEPGPAWESLNRPPADFNFRYSQSEERTIEVKTKKGRSFTGSILKKYSADMAEFGLGDEKVIAKFDRWAHPTLRSLRAILSELPNEDKVPSHLYSFISQTTSSL